jgi:hypothetical protein
MFVFNINVLRPGEVDITIVPATQEVEVGGSCLEASLGKVSKRSYLGKKKKAKGLGMWLKQ